MEQQLTAVDENQARVGEIGLSQEETPARELPVSAPAAVQLDPEMVNGLMRRLNQEEGTQTNPHWMLPEERATFLEGLVGQAAQERRQRRMAVEMLAVGLLLFSALMVALSTGRLPYAPYIILPTVITYVVAWFSVNRAEFRWGRAVKKMAGCEEMSATGPLMEALILREKGTVKVAEKALQGLLPRLQASDSAWITDFQRECLYGRMRPANARISPDFVIAGLKGLEQIGDVKALPCVEALAAAPSTSAAGDRLRAAAVQCQEYLRAKAEEAQWSDHLLRASSGQTVASDTLLRPAAEAAANAEGLLLPSAVDAE